MIRPKFFAFVEFLSRITNVENTDFKGVLSFEPYDFVDELFSAATVLIDSIFEPSYCLPDVTTARFAVNDDALAKDRGELGVIPKDKTDIINEYAKAELLDVKAIGEFFKSSITIVPLLKEFKRILPDNAGEYVHWGAT